VTLHEPFPFDNLIASLQQNHLQPSRVSVKSLEEQISDSVGDWFQLPVFQDRRRPHPVEVVVWS
jgi:hypothetical protein